MDNLGAGGAHIKIGGMFDQGQTKIIKLTQKMIELLSIISYNTSPYGTGTITTGTGGNANQGGNTAGGV